MEFSKCLHENNQTQEVEIALCLPFVSWILLWYSNPPPPLLTIMARLWLESVKVILYIRMLFREGELGSPSSRRLARRGDDGGLGPGDTDRGETGPVQASTPALPPRTWVCEYLGSVQNCGGRGKIKNGTHQVKLSMKMVFGSVGKVE